VKDEEVKEKDEIKEVEKLEDTKIGTVNQEGTKDEGIVAPPVETGTGKVEAPKQEEDYDKVFTVVQIPAEFPGGLPAWTKYLERNLNRDLPVNNGAPPGKYTVVVSFIVDKNGGISEVQAENDPGYGTKEEAVRVIKKGPSWKAAVQNGRNVIYRHKQSITFQVSEE
jgi:protein TonB